MTKVNSRMVCSSSGGFRSKPSGGALAADSGLSELARGTGGAEEADAVGFPGGSSVYESGLLHLLMGVRPFQGLDATALHELLQGVTAHCYEAGELVFREGDAATAYLLVKAGEVEVFRYSHNGEERVFQVFEAGRTVAEAAMFMPHGRYPMCARSRTVTLLYRLRRESLLAACRRHSDLAMHMLATLSHALYMQVNKVDWISSSSASERLANYLLGLKARQGSTVHLPLSQRQLAAHLGIRAETLSRLFTDWQARGYVAGRRNEWELRDEAYLKQLASPAQRSF